MFWNIKPFLSWSLWQQLSEKRHQEPYNNFLHVPEGVFFYYLLALRSMDCVASLCWFGPFPLFIQRHGLYGNSSGLWTLNIAIDHWPTDRPTDFHFFCYPLCRLPFPLSSVMIDLTWPGPSSMSSFGWKKSLTLKQKLPTAFDHEKEQVRKNVEITKPYT